MLVCKFHDTVRVKSFFRSTFSDLYQGTCSAGTVVVIVTSKMAQNDILRFSEKDRRWCEVIGVLSLYTTHTVVRQS